MATSSKNKYIVGIGAANVDIYAKSDIRIRPHYDHPSIIKTTPGGVTRNILENASKLGVKTKLLTAVGDDIYGDIVLDSCLKAGIDTKNILKIKGARTGIFMQVQNNNNDMHLAMCDMSISKNINIKYINSKDKLIKRAKALVLDPSLDIEVIEYILNRYTNVPIFVDPISDLYAKKIKPYLNRIYCIKPNRSELENLAGIKIKNNNDLLNAYSKVNSYTDNLFVSCGRYGCIYTNENNEIIKRKLKPVKEMANASGAGDAFMAALLYSYVNDLKVEKTVDYALSAGTATILDEHTINPNLSVKLLRKIIKEYK